MGIRIQRPNITAALQRLFRLTGNPQFELEPFVIGTVKLADLSVGSEPAVRRHVVSKFVQAPQSGERCLWRIEVPPSVICVVTDLSVKPGSGSTNVFMAPTSEIASADLDLTAAASFTDGRLQFPSLQEPAVSVVHGTRVTEVPGVWQLSAVAIPDTAVWKPTGWIIGSGTLDQFGFMEFGVSGGNQTITVTLEWDEYQIV